MPDSITRITLERFDVPDGNYETVIQLAEFAPGANTGLHTHPGVDVGYMLDGSLTYRERNQPARTFHAGQSWQVAPGIVHEVTAGDRPAKVLVVLAVEKGKPMRMPWPADGAATS